MKSLSCNTPVTYATYRHALPALSFAQCTEALGTMTKQATHAGTLHNYPPEPLSRTRIDITHHKGLKA